ncbi:MAG: peptidoglycan-binding protein [Actinomycetota bacterium]|nr:peptidoglycan-binding protein [Actinomycetota bacterium]
MSGPQTLRRRRRVRWAVTGLTVLAVLGVGTAVAVTRLGNRPAAAAEPPDPPATATVTRTDLVEKEVLTGELGYGTAQTLNGRRPGTVTELPKPGAVLDRGDVIYEVDAKPVTLFLGTLPLYRAVKAGMTDGPDVRLVEENLRDLGFSGFGTPDEEFTSATADAIEEWQESLGADETGAIELGDVVVLPGKFRVATLTATLGGEATGPILDYTSTLRYVTASLESSQQDLAPVGTKVTLTIGGKQVPGTVTAVEAVPASDEPGSEGGFAATIAIGDVKAVGKADSGSVDVVVTTGSRQDVLAVPVGALLALAEGGYAVELPSGKLIAVTTGLFADGLVEVSGDGLTEGMKVVTTS